MYDELCERVDRLLHDAEHAEAGMEMALRMRDEPMRQHLQAKRDRLVAEANTIDPRHTAGAWHETSLEDET